MNSAKRPVGLVLGLCLAWAVSAPATVKIEGDATPDYVFITNAIAAAGAGAVIRVSTGTYTEVFNIYGRSITIDGAYDHACVSKIAGTTTSLRPVPPIYGSVVDVANSNLRLVDLDLSGGMSFEGYALHGGGLHARNGSTVSVERCRIFNNYASGYGGGIYLTNSTLVATNALIFSNVATRATSGAYRPEGLGGGIAVCKGVVFLNGGDDGQIKWNVAQFMGGGIYVGDGARCVLSNETTDILANTAGLGGGIAVTDASRLEVLNGADVCGNTAYENGGGIELRNNSTALIQGVSTYIGYNAVGLGPNIAATNGGGIDARNSILEIRNAVRVAHNKAYSYGGGIYLSNALCVVDGSSIGYLSGSTHSNDAQLGGGVMMDNNAELVLTNNALIHHNHSTSAGAGIYAYLGGRVALYDSVVRFNRSDSFGGGGLCLFGATVTGRNSAVHDNATGGNGCGGGLMAWRCRGDFDTVRISTNRAGGHGGGVWWSGGAGYPLTIVGDSHIWDNVAGTNGGGMVLEAPADLTSVYFRHNDASNHGGAFFISNAVVSVNDPFVEYNDADAGGDGNGDGGAMWVGYGSTVTIYTALAGYAPFNDNSAQRGGGICAAGRSDVRLYEWIANLALDRNRAAQDGGGIALYDSSLTITGEVLITKNSARGAGGGIYATNSVVQLSGGGAFGSADTNDANWAGGSGGGLAVVNATVLMARVDFRCNYASNYTGGADFIFSRVAGTNLVFAGNRSLKEDGGGFYGLASEGAFRSLFISNNTAALNGGGGVWVEGCLRLASSRVVSNNARDGAGMLLLAGTNYFNTVTIEGNRALRNGGGLIMFSNARLVGTNLALLGNVADADLDNSGNGGGMQARGAWIFLYATNGQVRISDNRAVNGGGIAVSNGYCLISGPARVEGNRAAVNGGGFFVAGGTAEVVNAYILRNAATNGSGGGVLIASNATAALRNCVLAENIIHPDEYGGGLYNQKGAAILITCTVVSNAVGGVECTKSGCSLDMGGSIVFGHALINVTDGYNLQYCCVQGGYAGVGNFDANPLVYGSNYHLTAWSPCRDRGWAAVGEYDIDGEARVGNIDVGFDEFVDADGDQLPNMVETDTGIWAGDTDMGTDPLTTDTDGDGASDGDEWLADTDPNTFASRLQFTGAARDFTGARVYWSGGTNAGQRVEYATDLRGTNWQLGASYPAPTAGNHNYLFITDPAAAVFRVRASRMGF